MCSSPTIYDNNKLLYIWHLLGCLLVASLLMDWFSKVRAIPWRALGLCLCCFIAMFGSVLTVGREALSDYWQWSADDIAWRIILMTMRKPMQYS